MGIKNLTKIIMEYAPSAIEYKKIGDFQGTILGIDANLMIYKLIFAIRKNGYDLKNHDDTVVTHIHTILYRLISFRNHKIIPVFVFDGSYPDIKEKTMNDRKEQHKFLQNKYLTAETEEDRKKYYYMKSGITENEMKQIKELFNIFGYDYIDSIEEADSQLAYMNRNKFIDGVVSDDLDILLFGGRLLLKNFSVVKDKKNRIQVIDLNKFLKEADITYDQLIDLGILLGSDYCGTIKGIGSKSAFKYIKKYGSIDNMIKKKIIDKSYSCDYIKTREYFKNPKVNERIKKKNLNPDIDFKKLASFLHKMSYKEDYLLKIIKKIDF